jgi:hypothetical protein
MAATDTAAVGFGTTTPQRPISGAAAIPGGLLVVGAVAGAAPLVRGGAVGSHDVPGELLAVEGVGEPVAGDLAGLVFDER